MGKTLMWQDMSLLTRLSNSFQYWYLIVSVFFLEMELSCETSSSNLPKADSHNALCPLTQCLLVPATSQTQTWRSLQPVLRREFHTSQLVWKYLTSLECKFVFPLSQPEFPSLAPGGFGCLFPARPQAEQEPKVLSILCQGGELIHHSSRHSFTYLQHSHRQPLKDYFQWHLSPTTHSRLVKVQL